MVKEILETLEKKRRGGEIVSCKWMGNIPGPYKEENT
jgi:hypothetical protein